MFEIGDRVAYKAAWLRSVGADRELAQARGKVVGLQKLGQNTLVEIEWESGDFPKRVLAPNICKVGSVAFGDCHAK